MPGNAPTRAPDLLCSPEPESRHASGSQQSGSWLGLGSFLELRRLHTRTLSPMAPPRKGSTKCATILERQSLAQGRVRTVQATAGLSSPLSLAVWVSEPTGTQVAGMLPGRTASNALRLPTACAVTFPRYRRAVQEGAPVKLRRGSVRSARLAPPSFPFATGGCEAPATLALGGAQA